MKFLVLITAIVTGVQAASIYVSPTGSDSAAGTLAAPLLSIQAAVNKAVAGDSIFLRAGTYSPATNIQITKSGTASKPYVMRPYNSEKVVIDGEALPYTPADLGGSIPNGSRGIFHIQNAEYWKFYNLELIHGPYAIFSRDASNNYYEGLITRDNYETGFQIQGVAANNTVLNLDSYNNRDPRKNGESADGIGIKEGSGDGNIISGARLWNNVDDGLDFWEFKSAITVKNTISWGNGFNRWNFPDFAGDGNGFKLGGGGDGEIGPANHVVTNCIAFGNAVDGFIDNSQTGVFTLSRNTAWNNAGVGFKFSSATATLKDNVAAANKKAETSLSTAVAGRSTGNSWNRGGTWSNSSFASVDASTATGKRASDGKVIGSNFLVVNGGLAIGATTNW